MSVDEIQGTMEYGPCVGQLDVSYTRVRGIVPGLVSFTIPPLPELPYYGDVIFRFDGEVFTLKDCAVEDVRVSTPGGLTRWQVSIADRRWRWQYGNVSGAYNLGWVPEDMPQLKKTDRQLASILLDAMGEKNYDVTALDDKKKESVVDWQDENPAKTLLDFCTERGFYIVLRWDDKVEIVSQDTMQDFPTTNLMQQEVGFDPQPVPKELAVHAMPTEWEVDMPLVAVGEDVDGRIKPIADLSYNDGKDFLERDRHQMLQLKPDKRKQELAKKCIWQWYQVPKDFIESLSLPPATGSANISNEALSDARDDFEIKSLYQLEIVPERLGYGEADQPIVFGRFQNVEGSLPPNNIPEDKFSFGLDPDDETDHGFKLSWKFPFRIVPNQFLVIFEDTMAILTDYIQETNTEAGFKEANIRLRAKVRLRHHETGEYHRLIKKYELNPDSTAGELVVPADVPLRLQKTSGTENWSVWTDPMQQGVSDDIQKELDKFFVEPSLSAKYMGFVFHDLDGRCGSVTLKIESSGLAGTDLVQQTAHALGVSTDAQKQRQAKITKMLRKTDKERAEKLAERNEKIKGAAEKLA